MNDIKVKSSGALMGHPNDTHLKSVGYILWIFGSRAPIGFTTASPFQEPFGSLP